MQAHGVGGCETAAALTKNPPGGVRVFTRVFLAVIDVFSSSVHRVFVAVSPPAEPRTTPDIFSDQLPLPTAPPPPPKPASTTLTDEQCNRMHENRWRCQVIRSAKRRYELLNSVRVACPLMSDTMLHHGAYLKSYVAQVTRAEFVINVPYRSNHEAKFLGAKFCPDIRKWYVPVGYRLIHFAKWISDFEM